MKNGEHSAGADTNGCGIGTSGGAARSWAEGDRLAALAGYDILDTPHEPEFDDIVRLVANVFEAPIAVVNLIAESRQWFKAEVGIGADELPLDVSICAHAILQPGIFVVPDTTQDARFASNPLVTGDPGLRFYAGALLETPDGLPLGTVCVLDTEPRPGGITEHQRLTLEVLARQVMTQLELRRALSQRDQRAERLEAEVQRRRDAEAALEHVTRRLDAVLNNTRMAVFLMDERQHCTYANAAAEALTGYTFHEMQGRALHDVVHHKKPDGSHYPIEECPIDRAFPERAQVSGEELFVARDGTFYPVAFTASPVGDDEGRPIGTVIEARNITLEKARDAALRESEAQFRLMADAVPQIVWLTDAEGRVEFFNKQWFDYIGLRDVPPSAGDVAANYVHPDDQAATMAAFTEAQRTGTTYCVEHRIRSASGDYRWFLVRGEPHRDSETGEVVRWFGSSVDIHDRKVTEEALRDSEARLAFLDRLGAATAALADADAVLATTTRLLGEHLNLAICAYADMDEDQDGFTIRGDWAAPGSKSIVGHYSLADFGKLAVEKLGAGLPLVVSDNLRELAPEEAATFQSIGIAATICMPLVKEGRLTALMAIHDRVPRVWTDAELGLLREVTARSWAHVERVGAVAELRTSEARLRELNDTLERQVEERAAAVRLYENIVQSDRSPVCAFDKQYRLIAFNRAHNDEFRRVNGFETKVGDVLPDLFIPEQQPVMRGLMSRALSGERFTVIEEFGRPELDKPYWEITYTPLRDGSGEIIGAFHHARDISERLRAEAQLTEAQEALRQSQKMEAMGQLTGGVAHDFNNLLTPIIGSLDMLVRRELGSERERRLIGGALQSAERAKTLVQRLLAFARRQPLQPTAVDVKGLVSGMADLIASTSGPQIDVRVRLADDLPPAVADANQLEMAILNLAVNARDAMPNGGILTISAARESVRPGHRSKLPQGHYVRLTVADTGMGMDQATLSRAIEPFFSTKGIGKGTGLGLSMVHGLASQLDGGLTISSAPGEGTEIDLWLPVSLIGAKDEACASGSPAKPRGRGTALLVDDEELVRMSTADMLMDLGYIVVEASSAEDALKLVGEGLRPDLLVTDHLMPGMTGVELARDLRSRRPELPVLIVSGYAEAEGIAPEIARLTKPFRNSELAESLSALMNVPVETASLIHQLGE
jgi:PAS domain S-box-containing protein